MSNETADQRGWTQMNAKGLIDDYNDGTLSEQDLMRELWAERPMIMTILTNRYGYLTPCFQLDLISAESNGIKFSEGGQNVFFETAQYLDANGDVIPGFERQYNNAVRANAILNDVYADFAAICPGCPVNNQCCKEVGNQTECNPHTGLACCNTGPNQWNCDAATTGNPCPE